MVAGVPACHVLIIEDEWLIAQHLTSIATEAGGTSVATACTQDEAVDAAFDHVPDIILSDVKLLSGTGPCAVQAITLALGQIPVIFITGTPAACQPCDPRAVILVKPASAVCIIKVFKQLMSANLACTSP